MSIAIDIILVALALICLIYGWRRGFINAVMKLLSFIIAGIGAYMFHSYPAEYIYNKMLLPKLSDMISDSILSGGAGMTLAELFNTKPEFFVDILNRYSTVGEVESFFVSGEEITVADIGGYMASPIAKGISNILGFVLVFVAALLVLWLLTFILDKIFRLPVLKTANKLLGFILGGVTGLFLAWLLAAVIGGILPQLTKANPDIFKSSIMESSIVLRWLYNFNPLTLFKQ